MALHDKMSLVSMFTSILLQSLCNLVSSSVSQKTNQFPDLF
ncbi:Hypothetical protein AUQ45_0763 [Streptococcus pyogenes]|nr:Hypothetical protein AUQ45_0763 [Streptococcus pyogenes]